MFHHSYPRRSILGNALGFSSLIVGMNVFMYLLYSTCLETTSPTFKNAGQDVECTLLEHSKSYPHTGIYFPNLGLKAVTLSLALSLVLKVVREKTYSIRNLQSHWRAL